MWRSVLGWLILAIGLAGYAVECDDWLAGSSDDPVLGFVLATLFSLGGASLLGTASRRRRLQRQPHPPTALAEPTAESLEPAIFRLARAQAGRISAGEVSAELGVPYDLALSAVERLATRGACQVLVSETGATLYRFGEFEGAEAKRDLLE